MLMALRRKAAWVAGPEKTKLVVPLIIGQKCRSLKIAFSFSLIFFFLLFEQIPCSRILFVCWLIVCIYIGFLHLRHSLNTTEQLFFTFTKFTFQQKKVFSIQSIMKILLIKNRSLWKFFQSVYPSIHANPLSHWPLKRHSFPGNYVFEAFVQ